ncbi:MAG: spore coat protein U domain-containing protein [Nitrospira defluvii]|nr:spore coat protein U domain-containing protein [Nitrospira defluvii]
MRAGKGSIGGTCQRGIDYHITLSAGAHYEQGDQARALSGPNPTRTLSYQLYQDAGLSVEMGRSRLGQHLSTRDQLARIWYEHGAAAHGLRQNPRHTRPPSARQL